MPDPPSRPDPVLVREIARDHILDNARSSHDADRVSIPARVMGRFGPDAGARAEVWRAWCDAVVDEIADAVVSWPDEATAMPEPTGQLAHLTALWHDANERIGAASGIGGPDDPYLYAALLDVRANLWLEIGVKTPRDVDSYRPNALDVYSTACHFASLLDREHAARIRFVNRIPTLQPGATAALVNLSAARCGHCGRPWQLDDDGACERCPALLWGVSPANADEAREHLPGTPVRPNYPNGEDEN